MASSSTLICFQCSYTATSDHFRNGWRLRSGDFAQLCLRCASVYEEGRFCETYHLADEGWRDCESCGKLVHCGCVVSFNSYLLMDFGGITCMECLRRSFTLGRMVLKDLEEKEKKWETIKNSRGFGKARSQCPSLETLIQIRNGQQEPSRQIQIEPQYWPRVTDFELRQILRIPNSTITPLFEKLLSASDADLELARLVIPKSCAEAFFPIISDPHGFPTSILDTDGNEWSFLYRYWPNSGSEMHVLEGLRDYMILEEWQAGDTVTFYRVEPGGKLMMGLRKACARTAL